MTGKKRLPLRAWREMSSYTRPTATKYGKVQLVKSKFCYQENQRIQQIPSDVNQSTGVNGIPYQIH